MLSLFKKRSSIPSSSPDSTSSPRGLRPLLLVDKLLAAQVIYRMEAPTTVQILKPKKAAPSGRAVAVPKRAPFVVPSRFSGHRPRAPASQQTRGATPRRSVPQTNPKAVLQAIPAVKHTPRPSKASSVRRPDVVIKSPKKPVFRSRIPVFSRRRSPVPLTPVAPLSSRARSTHSKIPVFTGRSSSVKVFASTGSAARPPRTPQTTPSRIPRFKYATSVSPPSSFSSDDTSFGLPTPCPSPTQVVGARQMALKVSAANADKASGGQCVGTIEVSIVDEKESKSVETSSQSQHKSARSQTPSNILRVSTESILDLKAAFDSNATDASPVSSSGNADSVGRTTLAHPYSPNPISNPTPSDGDATAGSRSNSDNADGVRCAAPAGPSPQPDDVSSTTAVSDSIAIHAHPISRSGTPDKVCRSAPADSSSISKAKDNSATEGIMNSFLGELKTRLSWTKKSSLPPAGSFIFVKKPSNTEEDQPSELQQVLARRRQVIANSSFKLDVKQAAPPKEPRRPLASTGFVNGVFIGHHDAAPAKGAPVHPVPTEDTAPSDDNTECNPPGADFAVTELVTTPFGTRRVRRMVIPPLLDGARPSRDPRIVMELNFLRAKQKVGGVVKADESV
ncbi:hypothetical protein B0H12DRAFT_1123750 [Mycena haematopus]|nr:hypothetical protein B0H12DRAFT_1123750 [Mycena haematopus]